MSSKVSNTRRQVRLEITETETPSRVNHLHVNSAGEDPQELVQKFQTSDFTRRDISLRAV